MFLRVQRSVQVLSWACGLIAVLQAESQRGEVLKGKDWMTTKARGPKFVIDRRLEDVGDDEVEEVDRSSSPPHSNRQLCHLFLA